MLLQVHICVCSLFRALFITNGRLVTVLRELSRKWLTQKPDLVKASTNTDFGNQYIEGLKCSVSYLKLRQSQALAKLSRSSRA